MQKEEYEATVNQENAIRDQIMLQPTIGDEESPSVLRQAYEGNPKKGFIPGVDDLTQRYRALRRVRGDGNCFIRALLFSLFETLVTGLKGGIETGPPAARSSDAATAELNRIIAAVQGNRAVLTSIGYEETAFDMFLVAMVDALEALRYQTVEAVEKDFREEGGTTEWLVWFCRLLISAHLRTNEDRFMPFLELGHTMADFCQREVEPMGRECEQLQIIALCEQLGVAVQIEYLDGDEFRGKLNSIYINEPENGQTRDVTLTLLYRPGHYDLLYPK